MRDLKADLGLCNKAFLGPYKVEMIRSSDGDCLDEEGDRYYFRCGFRSQAVAELFAQAREGWPHAIERAIKAETLVREFVEVAEMLLQWWNNGYICQDCPNPSGPARTCISECCSILDDYRQAEKKLIRAKEVLGDV